MKRRNFITGTIGLGLVTLGEVKFNNISGNKEAGSEVLDYKSSDISIDKIISRGDIQRNKPPIGSEPWIVMYQGNGRFGSCYGPWGLHLSPVTKSDFIIHGTTVFSHIKHYVRAKFNADYLIPIGTIYWDKEPKAVQEYEQYQSFYDGTVTTRIKTSDYSVTVVSWFDPSQRDIAGFQIDVKGNCPDIIVNTSRILNVEQYDQQLIAVVEENLRDGIWQADIKCLNASSSLKAKSDARMEKGKEGLRLKLNQGKNNILIAVNSDINLSCSQSLDETKKAWHTTWNNSGWLDLPDEDAQKVWIRSLAYALYSHNDDGYGCTPPTGFAGNAWPFDFPFDSACRHLLLLMTGHVNIAKKWLEFYHSRFDGLKDYTQRLYKGEGIFLPHVFPYGEAYNYHSPNTPNKNYYPVYNPAILVRLADQTAVMVDDPKWTKTIAEPLILESARFYLSHINKGEDNLWHLHLIPSISLDEYGDSNNIDYVSGLIAVQYIFQKAIEHGLDIDNRMQSVLDDGLAFKPLLAENGLYHNHFGMKVEDFGKQKHPDQLFPLTHTPLGEHLDEPHRKAHELRYEVTYNAKIPKFMGHTFGEFILASARMHDVQGWKKDWSMMLPSKYTDKDLIQIYESSDNEVVYYITTHGLVAQSIMETIVSTWWNKLDLVSCIPWEGKVRFGNIRTLLGVTVSGEIEKGNGKAEILAWKDTQFKYEGESFTLKKDQSKSVKLNSNEKKILHKPDYI